MGLGLLVSLLAAIIAPRSAIHVTTVDRNGDGRPDLWQYYDAHGNLLAVETDTNFDGHSDSEEHFAGGRPTRLERDRNFDGHVDLIEDLDQRTLQPVRAIADDNFDGRADRLTLYLNGRPVFSQRVADHSPMTAAVDPFSSTDSFRPVPPRAPPLVADAVGASVPAAPAVQWSTDAPAASAWPGRVHSASPHSLTTRIPRGPPSVARLS